jgi:hypothetical protein
MFRLGVRGSLAIAASALAAAATNLAAAGGPDVTLDVTVNGSAQSQNLSGTATSFPSVFNYQGSLLDAGGAWLLNWDFNASNQANAGLQAFTAGNYVIQNLSAEAIEVELTITLPVALVGSTVYGGSVSGGLTTSGPGFIQDLDGPVWTGATGGTTIATLFDSLNVAQTDPGSSSLGFESFGDPIPSLPGPDLGSDLSVTLKFLLGANSSASFTSVFVARVPAPGALALLGLGGLSALSRRRRSR